MTYFNYAGTVFIIIAIAIIWSLWGYFSSRVEQTEYAVLKKTNTYEIRHYPSYLVAQTTVIGSYSDALRQGFRIVAGYIFGGNTTKESIPMTSPVLEQKPISQKIAMTSPVLANIDRESHVISFGMPRIYTLKSLPTPTDARVKIVEIEAKKMAVLRFSMMRTDKRVQTKKQELLSALSHDSISVVGEPLYAGYNAPWTPPWMMRHEILIEIE